MESHVGYIKEADNLGIFSTLGEVIRRSASLEEPSYRGSGYEVLLHCPLTWMAPPDEAAASTLGLFARYNLEKNPETSGTDHMFSRSPTPNLTALPVSNLSVALDLRICTLSAYWSPARTELVKPASRVVVQSNLIQSLDFQAPEGTRPITIRFNASSNMYSAYFHALISQIADHALLLFEGLTMASSEKAVRYYSYDEEEPKVEGSNSTILKFTTTFQGDGYGSSPTSVRLSVAAITTYCIITIAYIAYTLTSGSTTTAWNSAIKLIVLALQPPRPDHLGHTSMGIDSMTTFRESIGSRVNRHDELELVFAHDQHIRQRGLTKIERNKAYWLVLDAD